jgi:predicted dehydrogenase
MNSTATVVLVGAGMFGRTYLEGILKNEQEEKVTISGIVEPFPDKCACIEEVKSRNIPVYETLWDFYSARKAEFAVIASPIQYHCEQVCLALEQGSHVLCEKPISATVQEAKTMIEAKNCSNRVLVVGFQWLFSDDMRKLKRDIVSGTYGSPLRLKTIALWPRSLKYYSRSWAGKKKDITGKWILDSVANNAAAHYLHNMLYVTGLSIESCSEPKSITAELYRANDIENFDTAASRIFTKEGIEIMFFASHAHGLENGNTLLFRYEFTDGIVTYTETEKKIRFEGRLNDGTIIYYNKPQIDSYAKLCCVIDQVRNGSSVSCGPEAALSHTICINGMQESMPQIVVFPENIVKKGVLPSGDEAIYAEGLRNALITCYEKWAMPSELGITWAKPGEEIDLSDYTYYPQKDIK